MPPKKLTVPSVPSDHPFSSHRLESDRVQRLRSSLLSWYAAHKRDLPWRKEHVPLPQSSEDASNEQALQRGYEVLVSEIMLQQTRVATVIDYYKRFLEAFPRPKDLANASLDEVNALWAGLGYYSRAKRLREAAAYLTEQPLPRTAKEWENVPGCGPYTAGAVASIAYNVQAAAVDGNVVRVVSRLAGVQVGDSTTKGKELMWRLSGELVDPKQPGQWNQALMDIGSSICVPRNPNCGVCPLADDCKARAEATLVDTGGTIKYDIEDLGGCTTCLPPPDSDMEIREGATWISTRYPRKVVKKESKVEDSVCIIFVRQKTGRDKDEFFLIKRPDKGLLAGLWDFPTQVLTEETPAVTATKTMPPLPSLLSKYFDEFAAELGISEAETVERSEPVTTLHVFTHIRRYTRVFKVRIAPDVELDVEGKWVSDPVDIGTELGRKNWAAEKPTTKPARKPRKRVSEASETRGGKKSVQQTLSGMFGIKKAENAG
ncbi:DNA glycosylase [Saitoella complicata NRRL Y-17804]|uniref:Adenine DNA glycosylase n=1 Tax=Saitoella complicata (strain BCRC 22490 / CBS 7301 / JCM 7358 / NBRC 10748 / NRRL Y-17804) TaxID=698492 RepID=A0A0E9NM74_SAICN|nr:DNA glycosylase [Saitoella complicata NRRL Y-17804]ODQ53708.1 DNA glycosylase [Saitoella complicata NRRL Y-17804]GAO50888.1 hypothetical protein G7K_5007-t1 [Saitoella complicata NRRL Y-17804]